MLDYLYQFSRNRLAWLLLLLMVTGFELSALYFEHVMLLAPCVMCIYERVAMVGISSAAIVGLINPKKPLLRFIGLAGWVFASFRGLMLALQHVDYQFNPSPFKTCDIFVNFPDWAPLNQWMPWMFEAYGQCSKIVWTFLGLSMPQWLVIIFGSSLAIGIAFVLLQFVGLKRK